MWRCALLLGIFTMASCNPSGSGNKTETPHTHGPGPNGGYVFHLGKYHAEFTVDHEAKQCKIVMLGEDSKAAIAVPAVELTVVTKETKTKDDQAVPAMTIQLSATDAAEGSATTFVGTDPGLAAVVDHYVTVTGKIGGKDVKRSFKEPPAR